MTRSARSLLGLPVLPCASTPDGPAVIGTLETILINPKLMLVDGFLVGTPEKHDQHFLPRECVQEITKHNLRAFDHLLEIPRESQRVLGLSAWTVHPKFLAGFVHDISFSLENGVIDTFFIHQLIRQWAVPPAAIEQITTKSILINNDTTIKLKITPYPNEAP